MWFRLRIRVERMRVLALRGRSDDQFRSRRHRRAGRSRLSAPESPGAGTHRVLGGAEDGSGRMHLVRGRGGDVDVTVPLDRASAGVPPQHRSSAPRRLTSINCAHSSTSRESAIELSITPPLLISPRHPRQFSARGACPRRSVRPHPSLLELLRPVHPVPRRMSSAPRSRCRPPIRLQRNCFCHSGGQW